MKKTIKTIKELLQGALVGIVVGVFLGIMLLLVNHGKGIDVFTVSIFKVLLYLLISFLISIFVHELGHLVMGLLSDYKFSSFRFLNIHVQRNKKGKLKLYTHFIPGTLGQCLMKPPSTKPLPCFWYNFGGVFFNLLFSLLAILLIIFSSNVLWIVFLLSFVFVNVLIAAMNWFPIQGALNDGHNHRVMKANKKTQEAMFYILDMNARFSEGLLLTDYDFSAIEALELEGEDSLQLNVLLYLVNYYQLLFESEKYEVLLEKIYQKVKNEPSLIDMMVQSEYYFMKLLLGFEDAKRYKTAKVKQVMKLLQNQEGMILMSLYESFQTTGKLDIKMYEEFIQRCEKSTTPGVSEALKDYSEKLFLMKLVF